MAQVIFTNGIGGQTAVQWNAYSTSNFDPIAIFNNPARTIVSNSASEFVIQLTTTVPGLGAVPVRVTLTPATQNGFVPAAGANPTGVVGSISVAADRLSNGTFFTFLSVNQLGGLNLQAGTLTGPALFTQGDEVLGSFIGVLFNSGAGNDTVFAGAGNDTILGGAGSDFLNGEADDDVLSGDGASFGAENSPGGSDTLNGGAGADSLYGGQDNADVFVISSAADSPFGYAGGMQRFIGDVIYDFSRAEDDLNLTALDGRIIVQIQGNSTYVYGDTDSDGVAETGEAQVTLSGSFLDGTDLILDPGQGATFYGGASLDLIRGTNNADILAGFSGADTLQGGGGGDSIYGGGDDAIDTVRYVAASDSLYDLADATGAQADKVFGFTVGVDKLDFSLIAGTKTASIQTFGGSSFVYVDIGNNGTFDMTVIVSGVTNLTPNDLILNAQPSEDQPDAAPGFGMLALANDWLLSP